MDEHNIGVRANYTSGFVDNTPAVRTSRGPDNITGTADDIFATFGLDANDLWTFDATYIWTPAFWEGLTLRASILNFTDEDPMPAQNTNAGSRRQRHVPATIRAMATRAAARSKWARA
jgi:hypothetical protein